MPCFRIMLYWHPDITSYVRSIQSINNVNVITCIVHNYTYIGITCVIFSAQCDIYLLINYRATPTHTQWDNYYNTDKHITGPYPVFSIMQNNGIK